MNLAAARRRMIWMLALTGAAFVVAFAGLVGYAALHLSWGVFVFAAAIAVGVGAQLNFIIGVARDGSKV